jgi:predicted deacylase
MVDTRQHALISPACGTSRSLSSLHFGTPGSGPKVYIQASLHADELPGMLVIHHLRQHLQTAQAAGQLQGEVVLVPMANPIGLNQTLLQLQLGRFEMASGQNFNRHYPVLATWLREDGHDVATQLGPDAQANVRTIRQAMHAALTRHPPTTELESLRHTLMRLSCDADVVLDLHCDFEAAMHLYMEPECESGLRPLAQHLGAKAVLLARGTGSHCFDEALSGVWWQLRESLTATHGPDFAARHPWPQACLSTTVELRGQTDVSDALAASDSLALCAFLGHLGVLPHMSAPLPEALCQATPLAGSQYLLAPTSGVVSYQRTPGDRVRAGDVIARVVHPISGHGQEVCTDTDGVLYARHHLRWATTGMELAKIAGVTPRRTGLLLGP